MNEIGKKRRIPVRTTCIYVKNIPTSLKNFYKAYCAKKGVTMSEDIINYMKDTTRIARQLEKDRIMEP